ncbi:N-acetylmuramoyl-L-alanine amidase [Isobaculum melis]|uniref:N-acetylmuramoyl-L-alanine amidase n=1 Tax=Isobaculum melis TaxID=142588 RepID=A0A1H9RJJ1_9LACT|nr:N-acetylmuramoyl-L-alanine amidase [Isobaculum melis]SER72922.1 N-acetylmuramoyl-L-alanine amidase [Isobaculum melis]
MKKKNQTKFQTSLSVFLIVFMLLASTIISTIVLANVQTIRVEANVVNIRTGPGLSYDILSQVRQGDILNVIDEENEWYKVRLSNDRVGWIASWLISNVDVSVASNTTGTINVNAVNVRDRPTTASDIIGKATKNEKMIILSQENGWTQIQYNNNVAWISSEFITLEGSPTQETAITDKEETTETPMVQTVTVRSDNTKVRSDASIESSIITTASAGDTFNYRETKGDWYFVEATDGTTGYIANWVVDLSQTEEAAPIAKVSSLAEATIVIDPGHGGEDPGSTSQTNYYEKEITLSTAEAVAEKLRAAGANVVLTRTADEYVTLKERAQISQEMSADLFISIHYDSTEQVNAVSGTTTYYYGSKEKAAADSINDALENTLPLDNLGVRKGNFYVLRENTQPSILLELGYMSSENDSAVVNSNQYRTKVANGVYEGLTDYFK